MFNYKIKIINFSLSGRENIYLTKSSKIVAFVKCFGNFA
jgi:hypothetical protein